MMRSTILVLLLFAIAASSHAQDEEKCFDESTNLRTDRCLAEKLSNAERRLAAAILDLSKKLTKDELPLFEREQGAWQTYLDRHCHMAGSVFSGGRMESLIQGACRVRLTNQRLVDLQDIDVSDRTDTPIR